MALTTTNLIRPITILKTDCIRAFTFERGVMPGAGPYDGFNTCHYSGDSPEHVAASRKALSKAIDVSSFVFPRQTHSLNVTVIDTPTPENSTLEGVDALVTSLPGIALCIHTADCVPILLADPVAGVIAAVHSGWRGTVGRIVGKTVKCMTRLGADTRRIIAAMGPCICSECFEVGPEVVEQFVTAGFSKRVVMASSARSRIDLPEAIAATLEDFGVTRGNIAFPPACSRCNPYRFCSARHSGIASSRTLSLIVKGMCSTIRK